MNEKPEIVVIIPAFNEENAVDKVILEIPKSHVSEVIVVNNNSSDSTRTKAADAGATVIDEMRQGYGYACLKGLSYLKNRSPTPDLVVFIDADYSDFPEQLPQLILPIIEENHDMVVGSRAIGGREKGSMTIQQIFGNWLATRLLKLLYGVTFTDLGPFRVIKYNKLLELDMKDTTYGWTVEMQVKAVKKKMKVKEIPVRYRKRIGYSKVSGTLKGTVMAGYKIILTIFKHI